MKALVALLTLALAGVRGHQDTPKLQVSWGIRWSTAQTVPGEDQWRILGRWAEIRVGVHVQNKGLVSVPIEDPESSLRVSFEKGTDKGMLKVTCNGTMTFTVGDRSDMIDRTTTALAPGEQLSVDCSLHRTDARDFEEGLYRFVVSTSWPNPVTFATRTWRVEFKTPQTPEEVAQYHILAGSRAMRPGRPDLALAIRHFEAAASATPDDWQPLISLAPAYEMAGRHHEAITAWEGALQKPGGLAALQGSGVPELLARAHLRNGDPASARRVLRLVGRPEARIEAFIRGTAPPPK